MQTHIRFLTFLLCLLTLPFLSGCFYVLEWHNVGVTARNDMRDIVEHETDLAPEYSYKFFGDVSLTPQQVQTALQYFETKRTENFEVWQRAANRGVPEGQILLGMCYALGAGVPQDLTVSANWYRKAAERGHATAQLNLALYYLFGSGVPQDRAEAVNWMRKAAQQGHAQAQWQLGECYYRGLGVPRDPTEAVNWFRKAAEQGNAAVKDALVEHYFSLGKRYFGVNNSGGFFWLIPEATDGDTAASADWAPMTRNAVSEAEGLKWYRQAAEEGHAEAQYVLGMYYRGAVEFTTSITSGTGNNRRIYPQTHRYGDGAAIDAAEAVSWFRKAAENGDAKALYQLAVCYHLGKGVPQSAEETLDWLQKAEARGHRSALLNQFNQEKADREAAEQARLAEERRREEAWNQVAAERQRVENTYKAIQLRGHTAGVPAIAFSPDGTKIVTASNDTTVRIWDTASGRELQKFEGHEQSGTTVILTVAYSPDGKNIVTAGSDTTVRLWNAESGRVLHKLEGHTKPVMCAAFLPDGKRIASVSNDGTARLWSIETGQVLMILELEGHEQVARRDSLFWSAFFPPDGTKILTAGGFDGIFIQVWDVDSGKELLKLPVDGAVLSPDGRKIAGTVGIPGESEVRIWDAVSGRMLRTLGKEDSIYGTHRSTYSPDGSKLLVYHLLDIRVWNAESGRELRRLTSQNYLIRLARFSPDGKKILATGTDRIPAPGSSTTIPHRVTRIWDAESGRELHKFLHIGQFGNAVFSPDGKKVAIGIFDWSSEDGASQTAGAAQIWTLE